MSQLLNGTASAHTTHRSDEYYRIYGMHRDSLASSMFAVLPQVHAEDQERVKTVLEAAMTKGQAYQHEFRILAPQTGLRVVHEQARIFRTEDGKH